MDQEKIKKPQEELAKKKASVKSSRNKIRRLVSYGHAYIQATYNNTIITICDLKGNTLAWASAGLLGFKGPKKSTPFAAGIIVKDIVGRLRDVGLREVDIFVKGVGSGREAAIRALAGQGIIINSIKDITPIPHNGPRPPKPRRV